MNNVKLLLGMLIFIVLGGYCFVQCATTTTLQCDRVASPAGGLGRAGEAKCIVTNAGLVSTTIRTYTGPDLQGAESVTRSSFRGRDVYGVALIDQRGGHHEVISRVDEDDGKHVAAWLADPKAPPIAIVHERETAQLVVAVLCILVGLSFPVFAKIKGSAPAKGPVSARRAAAASQSTQVMMVLIAIGIVIAIATIVVFSMALH